MSKSKWREVERFQYDPESQAQGRREARQAARLTVYLGRADDFDYEFIKEQARRGVNVELGAK